MTENEGSVDAEAFSRILEDMERSSKGLVSFPQDGCVLFTIEERNGGAYYLATSPNTPFVAFVLEGHQSRGIKYAEFLTLCGELLRKNKAPAGPIRSFTPWNQALANGNGFVQFAVS